MKRTTLTIVAAVFGVFTAEAALVTFDFNDGTGLDQGGIGATMAADGITIETVDIRGQDGSLASEGTNHLTNVYGTWNALGINDANVSGNEYGSFDSGEAWMFTFDTDVYLAEIDFAGQGDGAELTISSSEPGFSDIVLSYVDASGTHDLGYAFISAGALVTFDMTSPTTAADTSLRIPYLTVDTIPEPATLGLLAALGGGLFYIRRKLMA